LVEPLCRSPPFIAHGARFHTVRFGRHRAGVARRREQTGRRFAAVSLAHTFKSDRHHDAERIALRVLTAVLANVTVVLDDVTAAVTIVNKILVVVTGILIFKNFAVDAVTNVLRIDTIVLNSVSKSQARHLKS